MQNSKKPNTSISCGIDGITITTGDLGIREETCLPSEDNYYIKLNPKGNKTEIALLLSKMVRPNNNIPYRVSDIKNCLFENKDTLEKLLKHKLPDKKTSIDYLNVSQIEIAYTVDLNKVDDVTIMGLLNLYSNALLENKTVIDKSLNRTKENKQEQYVVGVPIKQGYYFLKRKELESFETTLHSCRRFKVKGYSKGAYSNKGGKSSLFRLELIYTKKGIRDALHLSNSNDLILSDVLSQNNLISLIKQSKKDYRAIIKPLVDGYVEESEQYVYELLNKTSVYNAFLLSLPYVVDVNTFKHSLVKFYKSKHKTCDSCRKMYYRTIKKLKQVEQISLSDEVLNITKLIEVK